MSKSSFWEKGIRFQCQGSGKCCVSHGGYGYVYLTAADRRAMAGHLKLRTSEFTRRYCEKDDEVWKLKDSPSGECLFLENKKCGVYEARPTQCRTWPFWPEVLNPKTWNAEVVSFCPGVGRGRLWTANEIKEQLYRQVESEKDYGT